MDGREIKNIFLLEKELYFLIAIRSERHLIKKSNPMWKTVDYYCFQAKNIYNAANYIVRQEFINNGKWIKYYELDKIMRSNLTYYELGSQASQMVLRLLEKNWKSFFIGIKLYSMGNKNNFLGKPNLPKYKNQNGRSSLMLTNNLFKIKNGEIYFSWKPLNKFSGIKTRINKETLQIRFIPFGSCYYMEIIYKENIKEPKNCKNIIGIDLGINNFATISNNIGIQSIIINGRIIKSMNQNYNRLKSKIQKETGMKWCNKLQNVTDKHQRKIDYFMHCSSKYIIDYCLQNSIDTIIIGKNDKWKQNSKMGKKNNQNFEHIPYQKFISKLKYKCENQGINFIETEESYTSGTSFLDNELPIKENYDKSRRKKRGLFVSNNGIKINADLNGSYQIIKKVFPNAFEQRDRGCSLHPVRTNV